MAFERLSFAQSKGFGTDLANAAWNMKNLPEKKKVPGCAFALCTRHLGLRVVPNVLVQTGSVPRAL